MAVPAAEMEVVNNATYTSLAQTWENAVKRDPSNSNAWLNLFKSRLYENYTDHSRKVSDFSRKQLEQIVSSIAQNLPNSFTYHYCNYLLLRKTDDGLAALASAYGAAPQQTELFDDMMFYNIRYFNEQRLTQFALQTDAAGTYNAAIMEYNRNVLLSAEQNAVVVTYGTQDTYPLLILQYARQMRKDVRIVCMEWLVNENYRTSTAAQLGISAKLSADNDAQNLNALLQVNQAAVYVGLTLPPALIAEHKKELYCTGLLMKYSKQPLVNIATLQYAWEQLFTKQYLTGGEPITANYLMPMVQLYEHYQSIQSPKAEALKQELKTVADRFGKWNLVEPLTR